MHLGCIQLLHVQIRGGKI